MSKRWTKLSLKDKQQLDAQAKGLWGTYFSQRTLDLQNKLWAHYYPLAQDMGNRTAAKFIDLFSADDLIQEASFALPTCIRKFEPGKRSFHVFSTKRLHGAIIDYVRKSDKMHSRLDVHRNHLVTKFMSDTYSKTGMTPTPEEITNELGERIAQATCLPQMNSLSDKKPAHEHYEKETELGETLFAPGGETGFNYIDNNDALDALLVGFSGEQRLIMKLYFQTDNTMRDIGEIMDCSESRISQIITSMLEQLRARIPNPYKGNTFTGRRTRKDNTTQK